jgi:hypothetical protein
MITKEQIMEHVKNEFHIRRNMLELSREEFLQLCEHLIDHSEILEKAKTLDAARARLGQLLRDHTDSMMKLGAIPLRRRMGQIS